VRATGVQAFEAWLLEVLASKHPVMSREQRELEAAAGAAIAAKLVGASQ
jgi:hypothetical protein